MTEDFDPSVYDTGEIDMDDLLDRLDAVEAAQLPSDVREAVPGLLIEFGYLRADVSALRREVSQIRAALARAGIEVIG